MRYDLRFQLPNSTLHGPTDTRSSARGRLKYSRNYKKCSIILCCCTHESSSQKMIRKTHCVNIVIPLDLFKVPIAVEDLLRSRLSRHEEQCFPVGAKGHHRAGAIPTTQPPTHDRTTIVPCTYVKSWTKCLVSIFPFISDHTLYNCSFFSPRKAFDHKAHDYGTSACNKPHDLYLLTSLLQFVDSYEKG